MRHVPRRELIAPKMRRDDAPPKRSIAEERSRFSEYPLDRARSPMSNVISSARKSFCKFCDLRKLAFSVLVTIFDEITAGVLAQRAKPLTEIVRISIGLVRRLVELRSGRNGGIQMRQRAFNFLPSHQCATDAFKKDALRYVSVLGKRRSIPRITHG